MCQQLFKTLIFINSLSLITTLRNRCYQHTRFTDMKTGAVDSGPPEGVAPAGFKASSPEWVFKKSFHTTYEATTGRNGGWNLCQSPSVILSINSDRKTQVDCTEAQCSEKFNTVPCLWRMKPAGCLPHSIPNVPPPFAWRQRNNNFNLYTH